MAKKKLEYGKVDILGDEPFNPKDSKVRISILLEGDLLDGFKEAAKDTSHGEYQTLMKEVLRRGLGDLRSESRTGVRFCPKLNSPASVMVDKDAWERVRGALRDMREAEQNMTRVISSFVPAPPKPPRAKKARISKPVKAAHAGSRKQHTE